MPRALKILQDVVEENKRTTISKLHHQTCIMYARGAWAMTRGD